MMSWKRIVGAISLALLVCLSPAALASAARSSSSNYQVNEVFFGSGGELNACSGSYCSKQSAGEMTVGNTSSSNYQAQAGFNTDRSPSLEFVVGPANVDLGTLQSGTPKTATATFSVKTYLASGYVVTTASDPPVNDGYHMQAPAAPTASVPGTEQFGINLVANTSPATFGSNPVQVPDSSFSFGAVASGYDTPNFFKYIKGDIIASSNKSSGETDYTVSYLFNISPLTPGGTYTLRHILVATSTF